MFKWPSDPEKEQRLKTRPAADDLKKFMVASARKKDVKFIFLWSDTEAEMELKLVLRYVLKGFSFEWQLFLLKDRNEYKLLSVHSDDADEVGNTIEKAILHETSKSPETTFHGHEADAGLSKTKMNEARRILEQTFDRVPIEEIREMSLMPEALTGNLEVLHITTLLQSISMGEMSGRLRIQRQAAYADIFFEEGAPVHSEGTRGHGEEGFIQVICWKDGEFHFEAKLKTDERTIRKSMETLILEGCLLLDNTEFVRSHGVRMDTVLAWSNPNLSEGQFEAILGEGEPVDMGLLKAVYLQIDGRKTMLDIVEILRLSRSQWVSAMANLLRAQVVSVGMRIEGRRLVLEPKALDINLIAPINQVLLNAETGLYTYPAFLYLTDHEFKYSAERPLSIALINAKAVEISTNQIKPVLNAQGYKELALCIANVQGFRGIIAHYEEFGVGLVMMGANSMHAATIADRIIKSLLSSSMEFRLAASNMSFGIATFPDDAEDLPALLAAAEAARDRAMSEGNSRIVLARELVD
ncbi:MAG: DUF4388 domain-containing protein [Candidatus Obscuribacterales bacterium]|nr:DUF4388 domain-containing protein [Candidatus Obscuribacterales bacterium]